MVHDEAQEHRPKLRNQDSGLSFGELGRKLGADWKDLNEAQRRPYQDEADRVPQHVIPQFLSIIFPCFALNGRFGGISAASHLPLNAFVTADG